MTIIDFEKEAKKKREMNQLDLKYAISHLDENKDLEEKIKNYASRYWLPLGYVLDKLKSSDEDMIFNWFEKDPWRQNIYEMLQLEFVGKIQNSVNLIKWVQKLKSAWNEAKYIKNWKIVNLWKTERWESKSLDFYRYYEFLWKKIEFYSTCKYTKDEWWAQDNQANDVYNSFMESVNLKDKNICFIALVDGDYYHKYKWGSYDFYSYLNSIFNYWQSYCTDCDNLFMTIKNIIIKWLKESDFEWNKVKDEIMRIENLNFMPDAL